LEDSKKVLDCWKQKSYYLGMSKKFKQVAPASAPKPQPAPEAPPITKYAMIAKVFTRQKELMLERIEAFKASIDKDGCAYAMIWKGEPAMFAEAFLQETRGMESFISPQRPPYDAPANQAEQDENTKAEAEDLLRIRDGFERMLARHVSDLLGGEYASNDGPWVANSTSQMSNLDTVQKANVKRALYSMYTQLLACLDE
jgi:hypothetical protein